MMQGDMNVPATFVRVMEDLFHQELGEYVCVYIDNIFIFTNTIKDHIEHVTAVCDKLRNAGLYANPKKSMFFAEELKIVGYMIDQDGLHPAPEKIGSIIDWTKPKNQKELGHFNGMVNYISQFLHHAARITAPLTELTRKAEWLWTDRQYAAFEAVKGAAEKHQGLKPIDYTISDMLWLFTVASPTGSGAWAGQRPTRDATRPAAFHSRKLTPSQNAYPTYHQEALTIIADIPSFVYLLRDRCFTVVTDHESLTKWMTQKCLSERQQRWLTFLSQFDFEIEYQPTTENFLADYPSRIHEGNSNSIDIMLRDTTSQGSKIDTLSDAPILSIDTHYPSLLDYPTDSEDPMYYACDEKPTPTLTSYNSILLSSLEYLMKEAASYTLTRSQISQNPSNKCKDPPRSSKSTSPTNSADS